RGISKQIVPQLPRVGRKGGPARPGPDLRGYQSESGSVDPAGDPRGRQHARICRPPFPCGGHRARGISGNAQAGQVGRTSIGGEIIVMDSNVSAILASWSFAPWLALSLGVSSVIYLRGWLRLRRRGLTHLGWGQLFCFLAGLGTIAIALMSP